MARFDWYSATLSNDFPPVGVVYALRDRIEGVTKVELGRGLGGYAMSHRLLGDDAETLATVLSGRNGNPHCIGSGERAPMVAEALRSAWPDGHRVTRVDVAVDMIADFAALHPSMQAFTAMHGLKGETRQPDRPDDGATYYIGAKSSAVRLRAYEKGKELAAKGHPVSAHDKLLVRFEAQIRPTREGREIAATLEPGQLFGCSPWLRDFHREFIGEDPGRVEMQFRTRSTFERRCDVVINQWGPHLLEWAGRLPGGFQELGELVSQGVAAAADRRRVH